MTSPPAGTGAHDEYLPYGRQCISDDDIDAVVEVLRSAWLTTGPMVEAFERAFSAACGASFGVAVNSGTAALHAAVHATGIGPGEEMIVPSMTFAATANSALYVGATPVFADVEADTLLLDPEDVARKVGSNTRAVMSVDYAGQPCDYDRLSGITRARGLRLVADSCHAVGATYGGRPVGTLADVTAFSFHPVKHLTTGEGGMALTADESLAAAMRVFRNHGITSDHRTREQQGSWFYEMVELGYNLRLTDFQCALGLSQLSKIGRWVAQRRALAALYDDRLAGSIDVVPLARRAGREHAYHLYVVRVIGEGRRDRLFRFLRERGIGVNVHYVPVHLHPYYRKRFGTGPGLCPMAEQAYSEILTLPLYPAMDEADVDRVVKLIAEWSTVAA